MVRSRSPEVSSIALSTGTPLPVQCFAKRRRDSMSGQRLLPQRRPCQAPGCTRHSEPRTRAKNVQRHRSHGIQACTDVHSVGSHASVPLRFRSGAAPSASWRVGVRGAYCQHARGTVPQASVFSLYCSVYLTRPIALARRVGVQAVHFAMHASSRSSYSCFHKRCPITCRDWFRGNARNSSGALPASCASFATKASVCRHQL